MQIDITQLSKYNCNILTDSGYEYVSNTITKEEDCVELHLSDWTIVKVAKTHLFELDDGTWKFAKDIIDEKILTSNGAVSIISSIDIGIHTVYDLTVKTEKHQYFLDGVSSHNTGKTLIALSCAMKLIDQDRDKYKKIYYIRRTVISGTKEDELGFLPGTLEEKMIGYNQPMEDSLKKVAQLKKRGASKEVIEALILDFKSKYEIEYLYAGHLRGSTLEDGSILIADEIQNWDITSIRTIFSRMGKNSHIIAMGSNNQIDSQYLTKNTNALTFLMDKAGKENESDIRVVGVKLTNVMRSKLAEWADLELW